MFKRIKQRIGANGPGLTIAVIAMVVALTGGAFAAAGKLTSARRRGSRKDSKKDLQANPANPVLLAPQAKTELTALTEKTAPLVLPAKTGRTGRPGRPGLTESPL